MLDLVVVDDPTTLGLEIPGVRTVSARQYLTDPASFGDRGTRVHNLCRSYSYQKLGYYVSLLAEARGHKARPDVQTVRDLQSQNLTRLVGDELSALVQRTLGGLRAESFVLSIYFGQPLAERDRRLAKALSDQFRAPLLRARFSKRDDVWRLDHIGPIPLSDIPAGHMEFVRDAAREWFARSPSRSRRKRPTRCHMAVLVDPTEAHPPSDERALKRFEKAAQSLDIELHRIEKSDYDRINEFDALLIRATTAVNHYSYRFARRASAEGLVVVDDPRSILLCTNKVYLAEILNRRKIAAPRTMVVHRDNRAEVQDQLGLPCVLKEPDSAFSAGVAKAIDPGDLEQKLDQLLARSELVIAQEFLPTDFDWRVGVFDDKPLYACRYHMARSHWQIIKHGTSGRTTSGKVDTMPVEEAPPAVIKTALRAARLIGRGLYGVDLKQVGKRILVIEVNDNPNLDAGYEDKVLGAGLYERILGGMLARVEKLRGQSK